MFSLGFHKIKKYLKHNNFLTQKLLIQRSVKLTTIKILSCSKINNNYNLLGVHDTTLTNRKVNVDSFKFYNHLLPQTLQPTVLKQNSTIGTMQPLSMSSSFFFSSINNLVETSKKG